jgi:hypothetical protein
MMLADLNGRYQFGGAFVPKGEGVTENWQLYREAYKAAAA